ncbi:MAG TPA: hypothetical protein DDW23_05880 [Planctomycetes bacterium]|nr:hypothetical protein [Planctomycetota bacterium]
MELLATLVTDIPLDESRFRGVLLDVSRSSLAGAVSHFELSAYHAFGNAEIDMHIRDVEVTSRPANTAPKAALTELEKIGFLPVTALEFRTDGTAESQEDAWALLGLYGIQLRGWAITAYLDFDEAAFRADTTEGLIKAPIGGKAKGVLISESTLRRLQCSG